MSPLRTWLEAQLPSMDKALEALVRINSFTSNRAGGQSQQPLLLELFDVPGLKAEVVRSERFADHLVFRSEGVGAPVALVGHSDTVFPPGLFEGYRVDGDVRRGPGVLDMKGGLVVMAYALRALATHGSLSRLPPLRVVVVADEEVGSPEGARVIEQAIAGSRACLVFESGRANDAIVTRRKGTGACTCRVVGKPAHAGNNYFDGANAIWALSRFVDAAQKLSSAESGTTVNVGVIRGGTSKNTVPAEASAELDLRARTPSQMESVWQELNRAAEQAAASVPGTSLELVAGPRRPPLERTDASVRLLASYAAFAKENGLNADEAPEQGGGSDANTAAAMGVPSIDGLGPRGKHFHTPDEYIEWKTMTPKAAALAEWLEAVVL